MRSHSMFRASLGSVLLSVCACSGVDATLEDGLQQPGEPSIEVEASESGGGPEVIERLQVGSHQLTFHRVMVPEAGGPEASILLLETGTLDSPAPLTALTGANGPLTMLEIFEAYAPPGHVAHEALVESHAAEAKWLGRADARVQTALMPKTDLGAGPVRSCLDYVFPDVYPYRWTEKNSLISTELESNAYICAGDPIEALVNVSPVSRQCNNKLKEWITTAVCNDGFGWSCTGGVTAQFGYGPSTEGNWSMSQTASLASNGYQRLAWAPTSSNESARGMSAIGSPQSFSGNPCTVFHVVSGVAVP